MSWEKQRDAASGGQDPHLAIASKYKLIIRMLEIKLRFGCIAPFEHLGNFDISMEIVQIPLDIREI